MEEEKKIKPTLNDANDDNNVTVSDDGGRDKRRRRRRIYVNLKCPLCEAGEKDVNYKDVYQLKKYASVRGKIISTEKSGVCSKHQRQLTRAIKRARYMALMPYVAAE